MVQLIFPFENEFDKTNYNGIETIEKYCSKKPELVFLDSAMPKLNGLNVLKKFDSKIHPSKIIMIISNDNIKIFEKFTCLDVLFFYKTI